MDSVAYVAWKTATGLLLASSLVWLAQKGCVPDPGTTPRPAYERQRVGTLATPLRSIMDHTAAAQEGRDLRG